MSNKVMIICTKLSFIYQQYQAVYTESGPFIETPRIFLCMQNINYAEI